MVLPCLKDILTDYPGLGAYNPIAGSKVSVVVGGNSKNGIADVAISADSSEMEKSLMEFEIKSGRFVPFPLSRRPQPSYSNICDPV